MPDQYVLLALQRLELAKPDRGSVFAEVDLVSSHAPWTRIPPLIGWSQVGDGSVFNRLPVDERSLGGAAQAYGRSIQYSLSALFSFVQHYGRDNLVMVVLGDHQPAHTVSGYGVSHDTSATDRSEVSRRVFRRRPSRHTFVAMRYSQARTIAPPSNDSRARHALRNVSWTASSASSNEASMR